MIALGLTAADLVLFNRSLSTHHSVRVTVQLLDLNHRYLADLSSNLLDGQVNIDADAEVTRSLSLQLLDPDHRMKLDSTIPVDGAFYFDRMIRVVYSVKSELLPRWVDVPIFCGPITNMSRDNEVVSIDCQGKESLALPPTQAYYTKAYSKGWARTSLVRQIMVDLCGETRFSIPAWAPRTPGPVSFNPTSNIWQMVRYAAGSRSFSQVFYDGRGVLVMRAPPRRPVYTFSTGAGGSILKYPAISYDSSTVRNVTLVKGAIPKGKKVPLQAIAHAPASHPLNAWKLARNGKPRMMLEVIEDDNVKTVAAAGALARQRITGLLLESVEVKFDAFVVPHLEPEDIYTLKTSEFAMTARFKSATIPLRSASMSVGYLSRRSVNRGRIRR